MKVGDVTGENAVQDALNVNILVESMLNIYTSTNTSTTSTSTASSATTSSASKDFASNKASMSSTATTSTTAGTFTQSSWLRLDANRSWSIQQYIDFLTHLSYDAMAAIEYIEEPLLVNYNNNNNSNSHNNNDDNSKNDRSSNNLTNNNNVSNISTFDAIILNQDQLLLLYKTLSIIQEKNNNKRLRIALDETLVDYPDIIHELDTIVSSDCHCIYHIIKPSLLGMNSLYNMKQGSIKGSQSNGNKNLIQNTISCTFETGLGLAYLVCLAACYGSSSSVCSTTSNNYNNSNSADTTFTIDGDHTSVINTTNNCTTTVANTNTTTSNNKSHNTTTTINNTTTSTIFHGIHALSDMVNDKTADEWTNKFQNIINKNDDYITANKYVPQLSVGCSIKSYQTEQLINECLDSILSHYL